MKLTNLIILAIFASVMTFSMQSFAGEKKQKKAKHTMNSKRMAKAKARAKVKPKTPAAKPAPKKETSEMDDSEDMGE